MFTNSKDFLSRIPFYTLPDLRKKGATESQKVASY